MLIVTGFIKLFEAENLEPDSELFASLEILRKVGDSTEFDLYLLEI